MRIFSRRSSFLILLFDFLPSAVVFIFPVEIFNSSSEIFMWKTKAPVDFRILFKSHHVSTYSGDLPFN
jgi:hypothetical protein